MTDATDLRPLRTAAERHHRAGGQRRHRQDATRSPRWPPATSPRASPARELMLVTFGRAATAGAARAGPASGWPRPSARCATPTRRGSRTTTSCRHLPRRRHRTSTSPAPAARGRARPTSTPPRSPPPTGSASRCSPASASPATPTPTRCSSSPPATWSTEVVDDLYVRGTARTDAAGPARSTFRRRRSVARAAVGDPRPGSSPPARSRHAPEAACATASPTAVRARSTRAQARRGASWTTTTCSTRLRDALADPRRGTAPARGCAAGTGSCWSTSSRTPTRCSGRSCERAFHGHRTLVLIGDPKQAIYAFRGADVRHLPGRRPRPPTPATLGTNWRSDAAAARRARARVRRRRARRPAHRRAPGRRRRTRSRGLTGAPVDAPLRMRALSRDQALGAAAAAQAARRSARRPSSPRTSPPTSSPLLCVRRTLDRRRRGSGSGRAGRHRRARPQRNDARRHRPRRARRRPASPACCSGTASVFSTPAARDWLTLLHALEQPRPARARAGRGAHLLRRLDAPRAGERRRRGARRARARGCASWATVLAGTRCGRAARGGRPTGTGLRRARAGRHRRRARAHRPAARRPGAARALRSRRSSASPRWSSGCATASPRPATTSDEERSRRLESDAEAVQVITVHRSKGLSSRSSTCRSAGTAYVTARARRARCCTTTPARGCSTSAARGGPGRPSACAGARRRGRGRGPAAALRRADPGPVPGGDLVGADATNTPAAPLHRLLFGQPHGRRRAARDGAGPDRRTARDAADRDRGRDRAAASVEPVRRRPVDGGARRRVGAAGARGRGASTARST